MPARGEDGLFGALEAELKAATEPLDCATLFDRASIREHAASVNRVSDYLGNMWRKGLILRLPAPKDDRTRARWLYLWKPLAVKKKPSLAESVEAAVDFGSVKTLLGRPNIEITDEGDSIVITLPNFSVTVKKR